MGADHEHRVCTYAEAEAVIRRRRTFYLNNCFCRTPAKQGKTKQPYCGHPLLTCISFRQWLKGADVKKHNMQKVSRKTVLDGMEDWKRQGLLFRFMGGADAICQCCACGCGWFFDKNGKRVKDPCDPSPFIEKTKASACNLCGKCIPVCAYGARKIVRKALVVNSAKCYGCSACEYVCPTGAIAMVKRKAKAKAT
ncbi:MAG: 4Fe-4S binding protein [Phycisphaerae bacterium]|nr:4Fe-4S binding protein [Phycisphaerae bacterium]